MRIGELAQRTGASPRSLRHYESAGLIYSTRTPNGYREFREDQVAKVNSIRQLLAAGLTLDAVKAVSPCYDGRGIPSQCQVAHRRIHTELNKLDERAHQLAAAQQALRALLE
jgi:DNA-binding transcriptional MerR regulator